MDKPQASHLRPAPRVGGLAIWAGSLAGLLVLGPSNMTLTWLWPVLFIAALPVFVAGVVEDISKDVGSLKRLLAAFASAAIAWWLLGRSEEHTSELQSRGHLVCRLLLEKKKKKQK